MTRGKKGGTLHGAKMRYYNGQIPLLATAAMMMMMCSGAAAASVLVDQPVPDAPPAGTPASPAASATDSFATTPGDIVVTASRGRAQSLQTVPMAVSAVQAQALTQGGIDTLSEIVKSVPSVNVVERGPGQSQITIRGISSGAFSITETGDRPLVSVYLDDVPISIQGANPDLKVFDLERVEVLRGPQGTLYGSGSMAGTIRYITVKPSTKGFSGSVEGDLGTTDHASDPNWNIRAGVNIPLSSDLAMSLTGYEGRDAGYINNIGTGKKDANSNRSTQARGALRWTGVSNLTVDASLVYARLRTQGLDVAYSGLPAYTYSSLASEYYHDSMLVGNITAEYDFGGAKLTSSSSYNDRHYTSSTSGFTYEYLNSTIFSPPKLEASPGIVDQHIHTFTQEVRLASDNNNPLTWSVGAFYEHTRRGYDQNNPLAGLDAAVGLRSVEDLGTPYENELFYSTQRIRERQFAFFGELNYKITDKLDVTGGLRYFNFQEKFNLSSAGLAGSSFALNPAGTPTFLPLVQSGKPKNTGFNPRAVVSYHPAQDAMIFAEVSRGFRYGSVNEPVASDFCGGLVGPDSVGPDHLWNYALGLKSQFDDRKITLNATAFFVDWRKVQSRLDLYCGYYYRVNEGHVQSKGLELESSFKPVPRVTFTLNGSYTDAKAKQDVLVPGGGVVALDGDRAPLAPKWIGSLAGEYYVPVGRARLSLTANVQYRSQFYNRFDPANTNYRATPDQTIVNANITYDIDNLELGIFGKNLGNSPDYSLIDSIRGRAAGPTPPAEAKFYGRPRTIGVRAKLKF